MITHTLLDAVYEADRFLVPQYDELGGLSQQRAEPTPLEVEMRIKLDDGNQVTVVERATSMTDLVSALERARVRLAMSLARGMLEGFTPEEDSAGRAR